MKLKEFINHVDDDKIKAAIREAEMKSSGEICLYVSDKAVADVIPTAQAQFLKLGLEKTRERNAVLFFFAPVSQQFAIIGDQGIHEKCGAGFWTSAAELMSKLLKEGQYTEALVAGIGQVGSVLQQYFPRSDSDQNEISDEIIRS